MSACLKFATGGVVLIACVLAATGRGIPGAGVCAVLGPDTVCSGCSNASDDCHCDLEAQFCNTSHNVCAARPVTATPSTDPCATKTKLKKGCCSTRNRCVNGSGNDHGSCGSPSDCQSDPATQLPNGGLQNYYADLGKCDPPNCIQ